jgi:hypothetical protein
MKLQYSLLFINLLNLLSCYNYVYIEKSKESPSHERCSQICLEYTGSNLSNDDFTKSEEVVQCPGELKPDLMKGHLIAPCLINSGGNNNLVVYEGEETKKEEKQRLIGDEKEAKKEQEQPIKRKRRQTEKQQIKKKNDKITGDETKTKEKKTTKGEENKTTIEQKTTIKEEQAYPPVSILPNNLRCSRFFSKYIPNMLFEENAIINDVAKLKTDIIEANRLIRLNEEETYQQAQYIIVEVLRYLLEDKLKAPLVGSEEILRRQREFIKQHQDLYDYLQENMVYIGMKTLNQGIFTEFQTLNKDKQLFLTKFLLGYSKFNLAPQTPEDGFLEEVVAFFEQAAQLNVDDIYLAKVFTQIGYFQHATKYLNGAIAFNPGLEKVFNKEISIVNEKAAQHLKESIQDNVSQVGTKRRFKKHK